MEKTCKRCNGEANLEGLPVGQNCLDALRDELAEYEAVLSEPELSRLSRRRETISDKLTPDLAELERIDLRIEELTAAEREEVKAEEIAEQNDRLATEIANPPDPEALLAEKLRTDNERLVKQLSDEDLAIERELLEIRKLEAELLNH